MKIVIPMAGASKRFFDEKYNKPKYLLNLGNKTMIERVIDNFDCKRDIFYFIVSQADDEIYHTSEILNRLPIEKYIFVIKPNTAGPLSTLINVKDILLPDDEVIVNYCDFLMDWDYQEFLKCMHQGNCDGGIASFRGFHPASLGDTYYAYMRVNDKNELLKLREKQPFTDNRIEEHASTGTYYFKKWQYVIDFGNQILNSGASAPNFEYYPSLLYNPMVDAGLKILIFQVNKFICLGTPKDYKEYEFWFDFFSKQELKNL